MATGIAVAALAGSPLTSSAGGVSPGHDTRTPIKHFIFLMQGSRTFDNYFGTYPGADGIPSSACEVYDLRKPSSGCVKPYALNGVVVQPVGASAAEIANQYDRGKMDGFVSAFNQEGRDGTAVMGHYGQRDVPSYWAAAHQFVLFDHFFSSTNSGERANRSYWVAGAEPTVRQVLPCVAYCDKSVPASVTGDIQQPTIFDELQAAGISWKFYVQNYDPSLTYETKVVGGAGTQTARVPLLNYARFVNDPSLNSHIVDISQYYRDLQDGTLPAVSYVASSGSSERSARSLPAGQHFVTNMVNQLMLSAEWPSSALMWTYDGSGGWYDHVIPPRIANQTLGLRVPALLISPYARHGEVNHTVLDYTGALAFIEKNWGVKPLAARDRTSNSLNSSFNFSAPPRAAVLLTVVASTNRPPVVSVGIVYWCYGVALGVALLLVMIGWLHGKFLRMQPRRPDRAAAHTGASAPRGRAS